MEEAETRTHFPVNPHEEVEGVARAAEWPTAWPWPWPWLQLSTLGLFCPAKRLQPFPVTYPRVVALSSAFKREAAGG